MKAVEAFPLQLLATLVDLPQKRLVGSFFKQPFMHMFSQTKNLSARLLDLELIGLGNKDIKIVKDNFNVNSVKNIESVFPRDEYVVVSYKDILKTKQLILDIRRGAACLDYSAEQIDYLISTDLSLEPKITSLGQAANLAKYLLTGEKQTPENLLTSVGNYDHFERSEQQIDIDLEEMALADKISGDMQVIRSKCSRIVRVMDTFRSTEPFLSANLGKEKEEWLDPYKNFTIINLTLVKPPPLEEQLGIAEPLE